MRMASAIGLALLAILLAVAVFAKGAHTRPPKIHYAVLDTVGNCSVIDAKPSPYSVSGLNVMGDKSGYSSISAAEKFLKSDPHGAKGRSNGPKSALAHARQEVFPRWSSYLSVT